MVESSESKGVSVRFEGDIQDSGIYGPEALDNLQVGGVVNVGLPGEIGSVSCEITEVSQEEDAIVVTVKSRAGREHHQF
ncbi:hypothetical protein A2Z41_03160 [Microgenomates group bacterium RBG_19FT_COMBO_39_10]|nr:MAG: hypothetical protein A2Z41_03160 [Microgenomates group bacterium RBG_19FT_COMBO_39_10]